LAYHITQRGNNRQDVFFVDEDRQVYLSLLREQSELYGLSVVGYCLMSNHVHLVVVPLRVDSLAKAVGRTNYLYTRYVNSLHGRSGHLWQNRFFSSVLDEDYFWRAIRYVERNPVRAGLVKRAWEYPWSSAAAHVGLIDKLGLLDQTRWKKLLAGGDWKDLLKDMDDEAEVGLFRRSTQRGRPLGSDSFMSKVEKLLGRRVRALPVGRPRKKVDSRISVQKG
jgi:putative transposase